MFSGSGIISSMIYIIFILMSFTLHSVATTTTTSQLQYETSTYGIHLPTQSDILTTIYNQNLKYKGLQHRNLQDTSVDKFAKLNKVLSATKLSLPDATVSQSGVDLIITELTCYNLNVKDVKLSYDEILGNETLQTLSVEVDGVKLDCNFNWSYTWTFFNGGGTGSASTNPTSNINVDINFYSDDYNTQGPTLVEVNECNTNLVMEEIIFEGGGIAGFAANILQSLVRDTIEEELSSMVCNELYNLASGSEEGGGLNSLLKMIDERLDSLLGDTDGAEEIEGEVDPLYAEQNANVPYDNEGYPQWVNFISVQDWIEELTGLRTIEELANEFMGSEADVSSSSINSFLQDSLLNEDGALVIDTSILFDEDDLVFIEMHDMFFDTKMTLKSISVKGLDTLSDESKLLDPIGNYTLQNKLKMDYLTFVLEMEAVIQPSSKEGAIVSAASTTTDEEVAKVEETFTIEITAQDIDIQFSIFMGINNSTFGSIQLGSIIHVKNILQCALSVVDDAEITQLVVSVGEVNKPTLNGFLDEGTNHLITTMADALFSMYDQTLDKVLPQFFSNSLQDIVNDYIDEGINDDDGCPEPDSTLVDLVDYRDLLLSEDEAVALHGRGTSPYGELFRGLYTFIDNILTSVDDDGLSWLNEFIALLLDLDTNENGDIVLAGDLFSQSLDISLNGLNLAIELGVSNVTLSNINSLGALSIAQPMMGESSELNNEALMGVGPDPMRLSLTLLIKGRGDDVDMHNEVELSLSLKDISIILELLAQMEEPPFLYFPLEDVTNVHCWMATMVTPTVDEYGIRVGETNTGIVLRNLAIAVAEARLDMKCIYCSSPMVNEMEQTVKTQEGIEDTSEVANKLFDYANNILEGEYIQHTIDKMLNEAAYNCPHSPSYQQDFQGIQYEDMPAVESSEDSYGYLIAILIVVVVILLLATAIFFITRWLSRRRHKEWLGTLNQSQLRELEQMQHDENELTKDLNKRMSSLVTSNEVPLFVRLIVPIVILGNVGLFLSGHLSLGATVNISGNFAEQEFNYDGFFEFSMAKSAVEMWNAGAKALAILIGLFSGLWPYTKLCITMFLWLIPPRLVGSKRRGSILKWLDVLGKWSMVDVFVLLMTLASFNISVNSPEIAFLPEGLYGLTMLVVPRWGLYANMLAQLVSQILSHVVIHYHRKSVRAATDSQQDELNLAAPSNNDNYHKERLADHSYKLDYEASSDRAVMKSSVRWILIASFLSLVVLVVVGCSLPSFSMDILGLVGLAVESGNEFEQAKTYYSVFDLASMIVEQGRYLESASDLVGLATLASLLVITVFIIPLALTTSLAVQWFVPMTKTQRSKNTVLSEVLSAWQYMEVYVLSIIIAAWQLGGVSEFILNEYCGELKDTFTNLAYFGIIDDEDAQCFKVAASVEAASWVLVVASIVLCVVNHFIVGASNQKTQDDNTPTEQRLHTDRWIQSNKNDDQESSTRGASNETDEDFVADNVSPITPRFTDYYRFLTTHTTKASIEECEESDEVETAVVIQKPEQ